MGRRNLTFARQRACDGREAPKIARHFPTAALSFEFSHSLQDLCTRIRALIQKGFLSAKVRCKKSGFLPKIRSWSRRLIGQLIGAIPPISSRAMYNAL